MLLSLLFLTIQSLVAVDAAPVSTPQVERRCPPSFVYAGDAPYSMNASTYAAALHCPNGNPSASSPPVLLVHGTSSTGNESWGDSYVPALYAQGFTACYVDLPDRAMTDMQVSSEYIAYNIHYISELAGGIQTGIISHSQGGPDTQWALQFWPSTRNKTFAFAPLSPDLTGVPDVCLVIRCTPSVWQQVNGSHYFHALHNADFHAQTNTTTIWTETDGVVEPPQPNANLQGATVFGVQDLCPGRVVNHLQMLYDAAGYAIALDALQHGGTANLARLQANNLTACAEIIDPHMKLDVGAISIALTNSVYAMYINPQPVTTGEPPIKAYAQAKETSKKREVRNTDVDLSRLHALPLLGRP